MTSMFPVQEEMNQWTGEKEHVRECAKEMCPMLSEQEKPEDGQKGTCHNHSQRVAPHQQQRLIVHATLL